MRKLVNKFYDIRKEEWRPVFLLFGIHFLLLATLYFLKPARDSLFLIENGPSRLPYVYILLALVSIPITQLITYFVNRFSVRRVLIGTLGLLALNILGFRWLFQYNAEWIYTSFYIWVGIYGILTISLFWILANDVFRPAQSKRLFAFLTLGAILGAISGSQSASLLISTFDMQTINLLYVCLALSALCITLLSLLSEQTQKEHLEEDQKQDQSTPSAFTTLRSVLSSPYQLIITVIIGLTMITTTLTDYQFKALAFNAYPQTAGLTSFLGTFYAAISVGSLILQFVSPYIIKSTGITGTILTRPAGMLVGAILMAVEPVLASVIILNGFDSASRYSIDKTGRELLFLPLSQHQKEQTKIFIDVFIDRFSRGLGGLLLLGMLTLFSGSYYPVTYVIITLLIIWIVLGFKARRGYVEQFRNSIQKQFADSRAVTLNLNEPNTRSIIKESLRSSHETQLLHTLILLEQTHPEPVARELQSLLEHPNREIKLRALKLLQSVETLNLTSEIQFLLDSDDPEIRLEAIYYLCQHSQKDPSQVIQTYLSHEDRKLQSAAIGCVSKHEGSITDVVDSRMFDQLIYDRSKDAVVIKAQIAEVLGYLEEPSALARKYLPQLLADNHPTVVRKAITSMGQLQVEAFIPQLIDQLNKSEYKIEAKEALASYGSSYLPDFNKRFFDDRLNRDIRRSIPGIFSRIPEQSAVDELYNMINIEDTDLRYHVIKALNKLNRRRSSLEMNFLETRKLIAYEAYNYFQLLAIKLLQPVGRPNDILLRALQEKMDQTQERLFRLLGLIYNQRDMYATYLYAQSISPEKQSTAIEFIDNILNNPEHRYIFPILDNREESEKLKKARELFHISYMSYDEGLEELINGDDLWLHACAIYSVSPQCPPNLQNHVKKARHSEHKLLRETAEFVMRRNAKDKY